MKDLTQERLREVLSYDEVTGIFIWVEAFQTRHIGKIAGSLDSYGYRRIKIDGCHYRASRLAWLWVTGDWPENQIDHKNGSRDDNRIANLRDVTPSENQHNKHVVRAESGLRGAYRSRTRGTKPWQSTIKANGKITHLGYFDTPEEAHAAHLEAKAEVHPSWPGGRT